MVHIMWLHHVASSKADDLNFCLAKVRSYIKTSDKNLLAKKILLRQKRCSKLEAFVWHLGTLESSDKNLYVSSYKDPEYIVLIIITSKAKCIENKP